jgi:hypothetical protein
MDDPGWYVSINFLEPYGSPLLVENYIKLDGFILDELPWFTQLT